MDVSEIDKIMLDDKTIMQLSVTAGRVNVLPSMKRAPVLQKLLLENAILLARYNALRAVVGLEPEPGYTPKT